MKSATSRRLLKGEMIHPQYACLIDKLGWLATISRPDIALAYSLLAKFAAAGGERHFKCAIGVVEYLAKTSSKALIYRRARADVTSRASWTTILSNTPN